MAPKSYYRKRYYQLNYESRHKTLKSHGVVPTRSTACGEGEWRYGMKVIDNIGLITSKYTKRASFGKRWSSPFVELPTLSNLKMTISLSLSLVLCCAVLVIYLSFESFDRIDRYSRALCLSEIGGPSSLWGHFCSSSFCPFLTRYQNCFFNLSKFL